MSDEEKCARTDCPGERGWEMGYGLAGGGMGAYTFCPVCDRIVDKWQDPEMEPVAKEPDTDAK